MPAAIGAALAGRSRGEEIVSVATVGDGSLVKITRSFPDSFWFWVFCWSDLIYTLTTYDCLDDHS